jgi:hypothetical protein
MRENKWVIQTTSKHELLSQHPVGGNEAVVQTAGYWARNEEALCPHWYTPEHSRRVTVFTQCAPTEETFCASGLGLRRLLAHGIVPLSGGPARVSRGDQVRGPGAVLEVLVVRESCWRTASNLSAPTTREAKITADEAGPIMEGSWRESPGAAGSEQGRISRPHPLPRTTVWGSARLMVGSGQPTRFWLRAGLWGCTWPAGRGPGPGARLSPRKQCIPEGWKRHLQRIQRGELQLFWRRSAFICLVTAGLQLRGVAELARQAAPESLDCKIPCCFVGVVLPGRSRPLALAGAKQRHAVRAIPI